MTLGLAWGKVSQCDRIILHSMNLVVWMFAISVLMQLQSASSVETYRAYAAAMPGDPARGQAIFQQATIACVGCHTIGEGSLRAGPDLGCFKVDLDISFLVLEE